MAIQDPDYIRRLGEQAAQDGLGRIRGNTGAGPALGTVDPELDPRLRNEGGTRPAQSSRAHGFSQRSVDALDRAKQFTNAPGTLLQNPLEAQARPRAAGGLAAGVINAGLLGMNASNVYNQTDGDLAETARQVAFDLPPAVGSVLGTIAGGTLGRRSPAAATAGMLAGGTLGDTGGRQIASGLSQLAGGTGESPIERIRNARPLSELDADGNLVITSPNSDVPEIVGPTDPRHPNYVAPAATATPATNPIAQPEAVATQTANTAVATPPASATVQPQLGNNWMPSSVPGIATRVDAQGTPEFSNSPEALAAIQGQQTTGNGGTFSVGAPGDAALAMQRYAGAERIRQEGRTADLQSRQLGEQRRMQQTMQINEGQIQSLLSSGRPSDILRARALQRQNANIGAQLGNSLETERGVALGQLDAQVQRERTAALDSGIRAQTALQRQRLAQEREDNSQTRRVAAEREEIAGRNAETWDDRVAGVFSQDVDGEARVPTEVNALLTQRAPQFAEQREQALRTAIQSLTQRADAGDPDAAAQLAQAQDDYRRFMTDVYRVGADGQPVELRPVREWGEDAASQFFTDVQAQQRLGQDRSTMLPELGGAAAGALAGLRATPGGTGARIAGAATGALLGALGGNLAEDAVRGQTSRVPEGPFNVSPSIAANTNRVYTNRGNVVSVLSDGSVVNLADLLYEDASGPLSSRKRTSQYAPIIQAQFDAAVAQARSGDANTRRDAEQVLEAFSRNDDLRATLTEAQRRRL